MTQYSYSQLETLWLDTAKGTKYASKAWAELMAAIAMAESSGRSDAYNPSGASGLWQILGVPFPGDPMNPQTNARMALAKLQSQGLGAWETYTNGAYKQFLSGVDPSTLPTGTGDTTSAPSGIPGLSGITGPLTTISGVFTTLDTILKDILSPSFWLRIASFGVGAILLTAGIWCLVRASDDSPLLPQSIPMGVPV